MDLTSAEWLRVREDLLAVLREGFYSLSAELRSDVRQKLLQENFRMEHQNKTGSNTYHDISKPASHRPLVADPPPQAPSHRAPVNCPEARMRGDSHDTESPPLRQLASFGTNDELDTTLPGQAIILEDSLHTSTPVTTMTNSELDPPSRSSKRYRRQRSRNPRLQQAMGLVPDIEREFVNESGIAKTVEEIVHKPWFEYVSMSLIFLNTILLGVITNYRAANVTHDIPGIYRSLEILFFACFSFELSLKIVAFNRRFLSVFGWGWNLFDLVLVALQFVEEVMLSLNSDLDVISLPTILRVCRALRSVRSIRAMKIALCSDELRLLASCVVYCFSTFCWAALFLFLLIYIVSIYLADRIVDARLVMDSYAAEDEGIADLFGSVPRSCIALFQAITGGMDWKDVVQPLHRIDPFYAFVFVWYVAFSCLGVMNLVTGLFVNSAMDRAQAVQDMQRLFQARQLFQAFDVDSSFQITLDELQNRINSEAVQEFLSCVDMDANEVRVLFDIIDKDGDGSIDFDEFVSGLLRLQGTAKSMDLLLMNYDMVAFFREIGHDSAIVARH